MRATLFVDASYDQSGHAGWGAWLKGDWLEQGELFGGGFRRLMSSPNEAELCGIFNALRIVYSAKLPPTGDLEKLMIQCDNVRALGVILGCHASVTKSAAPNVKPVYFGAVIKGLSQTEKDARTAICKLIKSTGVVIDVRHVKGHHNAKGGRFWVNQQCDKLAGQYRKAGLIAD